MTRAESGARSAAAHGARRAVAVRLAIPFWLVALGCSSGSPTGASTFPLGGATWRVDEIDGAPVQGSDGPTVSFDEPGRVSGSTGCNRYFASLTVAGAELRVGNVAMTFRACETGRVRLRLSRG
jgi:heat shock protein HslJ